jgi:hypothetical protein
MKMAEYCGVEHSNPYHLLGLHDIFEAHGNKPVEQVVRLIEIIAGFSYDETSAGKNLNKLYSEDARDYLKVAEFKGERRFKTSESTTLPRRKLELPGFKEHLETTLHKYFSEQALPFYARISDKVKGDPILSRIEFIGAWPSVRKDEDIFSLPRDDPRFKERPAAEALEMYPDAKEFLIKYTLVFDREGFQAWTDSFHNDEWNVWHREHLSRAYKLL